MCVKYCGRMEGRSCGENNESINREGGEWILEEERGEVLLILARIIGIEGEKVEEDKGRYRNREQAVGSCDPHDYQILVGGGKIDHVI